MPRCSGETIELRAAIPDGDIAGDTTIATPEARQGPVSTRLPGMKA